MPGKKTDTKLAIRLGLAEEATTITVRVVPRQYWNHEKSTTEFQLYTTYTCNP